LICFYFGFNQNSLGQIFPTNNTNVAAPTQQIKINNAVINIEVADTAAKRAKGLGGRDDMDPNLGMLFIFQEEKQYQFWMKGMKFPLDFIFISQGKVVDIIPNVAPPSSPNVDDAGLPVYQPTVPINMMLEVNSGFAASHNIKVGDTVFLLKS
jgi:uncharacterized membrane protein (UPF0127 family)